MRIFQKLAWQMLNKWLSQNPQNYESTVNVHIVNRPGRSVLLVFLQVRGLVRENLTKGSGMFTALFITSIVMFVYLVYVMVKPERF